ncbi:hypothetical protein N8368_02840 [Bacteroidia bacterium]|nr:hypothetical protein [Bacteroidia bacterium]MDB9882437.1 hypothetical protein [Bacteroidia bacterium]MDC1395424.1 hypothetical protein [Bacteroidia bacterium]
MHNKSYINILPKYSNLGLGVILLLCISSVSPKVFAQHKNFTKTSYGIIVATNGTGLGIGSQLTPTNSKLEKHLSFNFQTLKDKRQARIQNPNLTNPKPYVYGKTYAGANAKICYTVKKQIIKPTEDKPSVKVGFSAGPNLGFMKPYYVHFQDPLDDSRGAVLTQQNEKTMANQEYVIGPANWTKGFNHIRSTYGFHTALNITLNWNHSFYFRKWETGIQADYFPNGLALLYKSDNKLFTSIYTSYSFGRQ